MSSLQSDRVTLEAIDNKRHGLMSAAPFAIFPMVSNLRTPNENTAYREELGHVWQFLSNLFLRIIRCLLNKAPHAFGIINILVLHTE